jgi:hypothetical protein
LYDKLGILGTINGDGIRIDELGVIIITEEDEEEDEPEEP